MEYRTLRLDIQAPLARITLSRPESGNRIDVRCVRELETACDAIAASPDVVAVLVAADGPSFCAGWSQDIASEGLGLDPFGPLAALPCPVLSAVQGDCVSAGLELALACDVRIAAEDARFGMPDVSQGSLPLAGGSQRLLRLAGRSVVTSMVLLGEILDAAAAYRAGLVSRVVPVGSLLGEAGAIAANVASRGPLALRYAKEAVRQGLEMPLDQALRYELDLSVILQTTRDRDEGVQAFLEKRPPRFEGR